MLHVHLKELNRELLESSKPTPHYKLNLNHYLFHVHLHAISQSKS